MSSLSFKVTRQPAILVAPSVPTPKEILYLSNIDDQATLRFHIACVQFYRNNLLKKNEDPTKVIKEALGKVLVHYYPFAGRLRDAPGGKLELDCTGEGVLFVEADADVALEQFGALQPPFPEWDELLHDVPGSRRVTNSPILLIQAVYGGPAKSDEADVPSGFMTFLISHRSRDGINGILVPVCLPSATMQKFQAEISEAMEHSCPFLPSAL